jgi:acetyl esterase/lipase
MTDKELYSAIAEGALSHGLNVAVVEYTLAPAARMDRIVAEVGRAIGWLHQRLGDYGADPARIYVAGHSAGGHLTAMTMPLDGVRGWDRDQRPLRPRTNPPQLPQRKARARRGRSTTEQPNS